MSNLKNNNIFLLFSKHFAFCYIIFLKDLLTRRSVVISVVSSLVIAFAEMVRKKSVYIYIYIYIFFYFFILKI